MCIANWRKHGKYEAFKFWTLPPVKSQWNEVSPDTEEDEGGDSGELESHEEEHTGLVEAGWPGVDTGEWRGH